MILKEPAASPRANSSFLSPLQRWVDLKLPGQKFITRSTSEGEDPKYTSGGLDSFNYECLLIYSYEVIKWEYSGLCRTITSKRL